MTILNWLQDWFQSQCDNDWEHEYGIKIETLDNPGWSVQIDLSNTSYSHLTLDKVLIEKSETDWIYYSIVDMKFKGFGDVLKLELILLKFRELLVGIEGTNSLITVAL